MKTDDVEIVGSKLSLIDDNKEHIQCVFGVHISSLHDDNFLIDNVSHGPFSGQSVAKFRLSSATSQENIQKAKNFIGSLTVEGEERKDIIKHLNDSELTMILESRDTIERHSQAVLDLDRDTGHLCVFGKVENVRTAEVMINLMFEERQANEARSNIRTRGGVEENLNENIDNLEHHLKTKEKSLSKEPEMQSILQSFPGGSDVTFCKDTDQSLTGGDDTSFQTDGDSACHAFVQGVTKVPDHVAIPRCHFVVRRDSDKLGDFSVDKEALKNNKEDSNVHLESTLSNFNISSPQSDQKSSSDEEVERLQSGEDYGSKVEFALKLGYTENQLTTVINKLGHEAGENDILSELIKLGKCVNIDEQSRAPSLDPEVGLKGGESGPRSVLRSPQGGGPEGLVPEVELTDKFRPIVIDGSNVAMSHGNKDIFSCRGIELAVDWFKQRGHKDITVFVPKWRTETSRPDAKIKDQEILTSLEKEKVLVLTPSRRIAGKRVVCYDDRYIIKLAAETSGIVVSNDNYRDLLNESPEYKKVVEERLLMYSFVNDRFMPPDDPLGRHGPSLDNFLSREPTVPEPMPPICPYGSKKCTYGNKCKFYHPERGNLPHRTVTEKLAEQAKQKIQDLKERGTKMGEGDTTKKASVRKKMPLKRATSLYSTDGGTDSKPFPDFSNLAAPDPPPLKTEESNKGADKTEKWKNYDEKLTEFRKKMEQAEQEEKHRQEEDVNPDVESIAQKLPLTKSDSLHMALSATEQVSSRSSSPLHRASPTQGMKPQEQFLSGHLLLAKKLSDEAADKKVRQKVSEERDHTKTPPMDLQQSRANLHRCNSPLAQYSQPQVQNQTGTNQMPSPEPKPQPRHQALCRQPSLQGANDPRLHRSLHQQLSYDSRFSNQQTYQRRSQPIQSQGHGFYDFRGGDNYSSSNIGANEAIAQDHFLPRGSGGGRNLNVEHATLARMQSAPEVPQLRNTPAVRPSGRMVRQNSSSDTQLNMLGGETEQLDYNLSEFQGTRPDFPHVDSFSSNYAARAPGFELQHHHSVGPQYNRSVHSGQMFSHGHGYIQQQHHQPPQQPQKHQAGNTTWSFGDLGFAPGQIKQPAIYPGLYRHAALQHSQSFQMPPRSRPERDQSYRTGILTQREDDIWGPTASSSSTGFPSSQNYTEPDNRYDIPRSHGGLAPQIISDQQQTGTEQSRAHVNQTNSSNPSTNRQNPGVASTTPHPVYAEDAPIHPSDSRYSLYYHLCGLFPEQKVRSVMNQHPKETDPQELCAYIIGAK